MSVEVAWGSVLETASSLKVFHGFGPAALDWQGKVQREGTIRIDSK